MLLVIGGFAFALASAGAVVVVRALRRSRLAESKRREESERLKRQETRRQVEEETRVAAEQEALRKVADEARRQAEEEARIAAAQEAHRKAAEETRLRAEESARIAAAQEAQRTADDEARLAAEAQRHAEAEEARVATEQEAGRRAEESARIAAEQEAQRRTEAETSREAEEEIRLVAEVETRRKAEDQDLGHETGGPTDGDEPETGTPEALQRARDPRPFRPVPRVAPVVVQRSVSPSMGSQTARDRALPIEVRLVFEKAGFCRISLLTRRTEGMPTELVVTGTGDPPELLALQDEWYQDVVLPNLGQLLQEGIEWAGSLPESRRVRASLSGREIYVLARHNEISGFVSASRLVLGVEHVVLSVTERLAEVRAAIALTGCPDPVLLSSDSGIPPGWAGLRGIVPRNPIAPSPSGEILDVLRPLADVEIALLGGIRIDRQSWLTGFPPSVVLRGDTSTIGAVTIDGHEATVSPEGDYIVPGWDSPGDHSVWCTSGSRTYSIRSGAEEWQAWDAYTWSLGELAAEATRSRPGICGVLVRAPKAGRSDGRPVVVPSSNPVLIGAAPGEIEICAPRSDMRARFCVGFPWFEPIWAIPADALRCDKRTARVLLIGSPKPVPKGSSTRIRDLPNVGVGGAHAWCEAILTAGRKGLETEPSRAEIADLWKAYKRSAKALMRSWR